MNKGRLQLYILGCGSSGGVPRVDGDWGACNPLNPRNQRSRCSALIEYQHDESCPRPTYILIDTAPDMREQLLRAEVSEIDAVIYSHDHADQCNGIDDLRAIALKRHQPVPVHMSQHTAAI